MSESNFSHTEYAIQIQEKFELYFLGLIFTILALSIQTAKFEVSQVSDAFEILSWTFLLVSGLFGLSRFEWISVIHKSLGELNRLESDRNDHLVQQSLGNSDVQVLGEDKFVEVKDIINDRTAAINNITSNNNALTRKHLFKYKVHKWSFVIGLILLFIARSYPHIEKLSNVNFCN